MFFSSRRRHTRCGRDWSSDVCSSDLDADFVHEISIDPDTARGVITFYELPISSLMMVPGVGVEPTQARGPRDFKIGRASCRERVKISVVAVSLKQKNVIHLVSSVIHT